MDIKTIKSICFSPTLTTKKIAHGIAEGTRIRHVKDFDLSPSAAGSNEFITDDFDLAVIGAPVYKGRIPDIVCRGMQQISGNGKPAIIVVVYGNRGYDDALLELTELSRERGFIPVAGGAFIGEHSFADRNRPIAMGRPDAEDLENARAFGTLIRKRIGDVKGLDEIPVLDIPGKFPYKENPRQPNVPPATLEDLCTKCGSCADVCPMSAITVADTVITEKNECISCCACIKNCPSGARVLMDTRIKEAAERLSATCQERKEPEIYLS